jgi:hypothetical protein
LNGLPDGTSMADEDLVDSDPLRPDEVRSDPSIYRMNRFLVDLPNEASLVKKRPDGVLRADELADGALFKSLIPDGNFSGG